MSMSTMNHDEGDDDNDECHDEPLETRADRLIAAVQGVARANGVVAELVHRKNMFEQTVAVELTDLFADTPGAGGGTLVMRAIETQADAEDLAVYVKPGSARNKEFYARFGFALSRSGMEMVRYAPLPDWITRSTQKSAIAP